MRSWCYDWMKLGGGWVVVLRINVFSKSIWPREWTVVD